MDSNEELIRHLTGNTKTLASMVLEHAFRAVDRKLFVPDELADEAYEDYPLPLRDGQTISQPTTVAFMLELLGAQPGENILDIGSGSGWTTALLSHIVGERGSVLGLERIPELVVMGQTNLAKIDAPNARIELAGEELGKTSEAPFDRILVSAAAEEIPVSLVKQLKPAGRMVVPIQDSICVIEHKNDGYTQKCHEGFAFVPLITGE